MKLNTKQHIKTLHNPSHHKNVDQKLTFNKLLKKTISTLSATFLGIFAETLYLVCSIPNEQDKVNLMVRSQDQLHLLEMEHLVLIILFLKVNLKHKLIEHIKKTWLLRIVIVWLSKLWWDIKKHLKSHKKNLLQINYITRWK